MARTKTDYSKHGYCHDLADKNPEVAMRLFCIRRSDDVVKDFKFSLPYQDLIARVYYQGLKDGQQIYAP